LIRLAYIIKVLDRKNTHYLIRHKSSESRRLPTKSLGQRSLTVNTPLTEQNRTESGRFDDLLQHVTHALKKLRVTFSNTCNLQTCGL